MKRNKKELIKLSRNYLEDIEHLIPDIEKEILLKVINYDQSRRFEVCFTRGKLIIDLEKTEEYEVYIPSRPICNANKISLSVLFDIGIPDYSTKIALECKNKEDCFIKSILTELLTSVETGLDLLSILREIRGYCSIDTCFISEEDLKNSSKIIIKSIELYKEVTTISSNKYFRIYYEVFGNSGIKSIRFSNFNSIGYAVNLLSPL